MSLDILHDCTFTGPALPEPFVRMELEKELSKAKLLPKATGKEGRALQESWEAYRRKLRELAVRGGAVRVHSHVFEPLVERLGYERLEAGGEVDAREGRESGGHRMIAPDAAGLRVWATAFEEDLDALVRRGHAYRYSHIRIAQRVLLATGERVGLLTNGIELRVLLCDPARAFSFASTSLWRNTFSPSVALARHARSVLDDGAETGRFLEDGVRMLFGLFIEGIQRTELRIEPLGGALFGKHATPLPSDLHWGERAVAHLLDRLLWTPKRRGAEARERVHYGPLDVEDLGRVYEALLELEPGIATERMCRLCRQKLEVVVPFAQGEKYHPPPARPAGEDVSSEDAEAWPLRPRSARLTGAGVSVEAGAKPRAGQTPAPVSRTDRGREEDGVATSSRQTSTPASRAGRGKKTKVE